MDHQANLTIKYKKISLYYFLCALIWIFLSDHILDIYFAYDVLAIRYYQTIKGGVFVIVSAVLLFWILKKNCEHINRYIRSLTDSERRMELALETGKFGVWELDLKTNTLEWDHHFHEVLDIERHMLPTSYEALMQLIVEEDREYIDSQFQRAKEHHLDFHEEFRVYKTDGSYRHIDSSGRFYFDETGDLAAMVGVCWDISDRVHDTRKLKRSEAWLRQIIDLIPHYIYAKESNGKFLLVNKSCAQAYGMKPTEMEGRYLSEVSSSKEEAENYIAADRKVIENVTSLVIPEESLTDAKGDKHVLQTMKIPLLLSESEQEEQYGVLGVSVDITYLKEIECDLEEQMHLAHYSADVCRINVEDDSLRNLLKQITDLTVDSLGVALARIWSYDEKDDVLLLQASSGMYTHLDGKHGRIKLGEYKIGKIAQNREPHLTNHVIGDPTIHDQEWARREGIISFAGYPLISGNRLKGVVGIFACQELSNAVFVTLQSLSSVLGSIIDRKQQARELRIHEERMKLALNTLQFGIWEWDIVENKSFYSENALSIMGRNKKNPLKNYNEFINIIHPDDRPLFEENVRESFEEKKVFDLEYRIIRPDGEVSFIHDKGRIFYDQNDNPKRAVGIVQDVTNRKSLELQFQQAQKMETVGQLAGGVAHDFNNILMAINGYSALILNNLSEEDENKPYLQGILESGERAARLTRQLLAFSRKQVLRPDVVNLNEIIANFEKMLKRLIGEDIEFETKLVPEACWIYVDSGQLEQVIMNLAINARDAMPNGGKLLIETNNVTLDESYLRKDTEVKPGSYVMLAISDNGFGMDRKTQEKIFEPFFTTKESGKGTGLGLAMVYGTVKQSGGYVWVYSELGKGTTFKLYFPRSSQKKESKIKTEKVSYTLQGDETILVVDDDGWIQDIVTRTLNRFGYQVYSASSGEEMIDFCSTLEPTPDLLITDVIMPRMNGVELSKRLTERYPHLKTLYMSGYTDDAIAHHGVLEAGVEFLQKPVGSVDLAKKVREMFDTRED